MARKVDIIRGHELRKDGGGRYHQPDAEISLLDGGADAQDSAAGDTASALHIVSSTSSPDTALTAYAQLVAWRLDAKRSMVSLIGRTTQYVIAEATKTLDLEENSKHDAGDGLWLGCYVLPKENGLCESTVDIGPTETGFIIPDLSQDERFKHRPYVVGPPYLRFYAGTPLKSKLGINIGSLCIVDGRPREGLSPDQMAFLQTMAGNVMAHLELNRESSLRKRETRMAKALTLFLEGKSFLTEQPGYTELESDGRIRKGSVASPDNASKPPDAPDAGLSPKTGPSQTTPRTTVDSLLGEGDPYFLVFRRASNLLQQSLEVDEALFLDTTAGFSALDEDLMAANLESPFTGEELSSPALAAASIGQYQCFSGTSRKMAEILGFFSRDSSSLNDSTPKSSSIPERLLRKLLKRYPSGKIWAFHPDRSSADTTIEDFEKGLSESKNESLDPEQRAGEDEQLLKAFPKARQVLFVPLLDPTVSQRWLAGFFAWSTREYPALSRDTDLSFTRAFANNIIAEISRISIAAADEQKNSFISSISHELRSPLHGILGSNELLSESPLNTFQKDLVESIHSCGYTLLETLTSVLSYSKINSFKKSRKKRPATNNAKDDAADAGHEIESYTNSNIAVLCEEVVEMLGGSWYVFNAGHTGADYDPMYRRNSLKLANEVSLPVTLEDEKSQEKPSPTLVLEIQYHSNWNFATQPGALRRILMNIVSNSLKYTSSGFVKVTLQLEDRSHDHERQSESRPYVVLTVQDTGKGISPAFLKKRLFLPFAQENAISSVGMGLGLSIVKGLVEILDGQIEVKSQLGRGTETKVSIPMNRIDVQDNKARPSLETDVLTLRKNPLKVQFFGFDTLVTNCFAGYFINWLEYRIVDPLDENQISPDTVVINELEIPTFLSAGPGAPSTQVPALLVICMAGRRPGVLPKEPRVIERVPQPFGMTKLCKAVLGCIEKMGVTQPGAAQTDIVQTDVGQTDVGQTNVGQTDVGQTDAGQTDIAHATNQAAQSPQLNSSSSVLTTETGTSDTISPPKLDLAINGAQQNGEVKPPPPKPVISNLVLAPAHIPTEMLQDPSILLVDDNAINRRLLQTYLKKLRYGSVESAENGLIAVNKFKNRSSGFQVIFMDLSMPVMDGLSATRAIRAVEESRISLDGAQAPRPALIIALTGLASDHDQSKAFTSGVDLFVTKPVKFSEIGDLLTGWKAKEG
ncbi:MAG: hypothetical protein M1829_006714 [Trizodia sp. TS-e1964]|nr:MAG: hypothetical protein M1829_006714 [Trizodia sp. TS-e1964]